MLAAGDRIADAGVWLGPREPVELADLVEDGHALFLFFLFAWAKSQ